MSKALPVCISILESREAPRAIVYLPALESLIDARFPGFQLHNGEHLCCDLSQVLRPFGIPDAESEAES